jgi:hypothetical protein
MPKATIPKAVIASRVMTGPCHRWRRPSLQHPKPGLGPPTRRHPKLRLTRVTSSICLRPKTQNWTRS